ncbi:MAG: hypothetical protein AAFR59_17455 [Bacteroidota bacterium]
MNKFNLLISWVLLGAISMMGMSGCESAEQSQSLEEKKDSVITELIEDDPNEASMEAMPVVPELIGSWELVALMAGNTPTQVEETIYTFSPDGQLTIKAGDSEPFSDQFVYQNDTIKSQVLPSDVRIQLLTTDSLVLRVVLDQSNIDLTFAKQSGL